jgi:hypothetical protein
MPDTMKVAIDRINTVKDFYGKEEVRVEGNFIAVLLPASLSAMTITLAQEAWKFRDIQIPIIAFFCVYLAAMLYDLIVITGRNSAAKQVQGLLYAYSETNSSQDDDPVPAELLPAYNMVDATARKRGYIPPVAKILVAFGVGLVALIGF